MSAPIQNAGEAITRAMVWAARTNDPVRVDRMRAAFTKLARVDGLSEDEIDKAVASAEAIIAAEKLEAARWLAERIEEIGGRTCPLEN
jgi:hypothetical protein